MSGANGLGLAKHPDKTIIGRIARGFDFLGDHFDPEGVSVAKATLGKFVERAAQPSGREGLQRLIEPIVDASDERVPPLARGCLRFAGHPAAAGQCAGAGDRSPD